MPDYIVNIPEDRLRDVSPEEAFIVEIGPFELDLYVTPNGIGIRVSPLAKARLISSGVDFDPIAVWMIATETPSINIERDPSGRRRFTVRIDDRP